MMDELFSDTDLKSTYERLTVHAIKVIDEMRESELHAYEEEALVTKLMQDLCFKPLVLDKETYRDKPTICKIPINRPEEVDEVAHGGLYTVPGFYYKLHIPFKGTQYLFKYIPSLQTSQKPRGEVSENNLTIELRRPAKDLDIAEISNEFEQTIADINLYVEAINGDLEVYHKDFEERCGAAIRRRIAEYKQADAIFQNLPYPLYPTDPAHNAYAPPEIQLRVRVAKVVNPDQKTPYPRLRDSDFEHILHLIDLTYRSAERSPKAFSSMGEEALRTQAILVLNTHYEHSASGETFNYNGKTDIYVNSGGGNVFVAECKIWQGQKVMHETIDQLLSYTTWRDTRTAIIFFNREGEITRVRNTITASVSTHPNFKSEMKPSCDLVRCSFNHPDDSEGRVEVAFFVFDIPNKVKASGKAVEK